MTASAKAKIFQLGVTGVPSQGRPRTVESAGDDSRGAWTLSDRRLDRRAARTVDDILSATIALMVRGGLEKLSISSVCREAGVSRGTLYRYFSSKADLLDGVTLHLRDRTDQAVQAMTKDDNGDPIARLNKILDYTLHSPETGRGARFLEAEPTFVINYLKRNFDHFRHRLDEAMGPIFETWDQALGGPVDRRLIVDMLVRYALSEMLVPAGPQEEDYPARIRAMIDLLRPGR